MTKLTKRKKLKKKNLRIMSKQYAHLHAMAKTSVKFQNDWPKTVGGVSLTSQLLTNGRVTACLYRTCVLTTKNNVYPCKSQFYYIKVGFKGVKII